MKTPEEIKKGLECCMVEECFGERENCPYTADPALCVGVMCEDALAYIRQLEAERDAFFKEVRGRCSTCKHFDKDVEEEPCASCIVHSGNSWEWRGVQKEE